MNIKLLNFVSFRKLVRHSNKGVTSEAKVLNNIADAPKKWEKPKEEVFSSLRFRFPEINFNFRDFIAKLYMDK